MKRTLEQDNLNSTSPLQQHTLFNAGSLPLTLFNNMNSEARVMENNNHHDNGAQPTLVTAKIKQPKSKKPKPNYDPQQNSRIRLQLMTYEALIENPTSFAKTNKKITVLVNHADAGRLRTLRRNQQRNLGIQSISKCDFYQENLYKVVIEPKVYNVWVTQPQQKNNPHTQTNQTIESLQLENNFHLPLASYSSNDSLLVENPQVKPTTPPLPFWEDATLLNKLAEELESGWHYQSPEL